MESNDKKTALSKWISVTVKILFTAAALFVSFWGGFLLYLAVTVAGAHIVLAYTSMLLLPALLIPLIWVPKRARVLIGWGISLAVFLGALGVNLAIDAYDESITVNTTPNINVSEYMPYDENAKIVTLDGDASLRFSVHDDLPIVDGAAAVFPVYSAFVNAVYPKDAVLFHGQIDLMNSCFQYNNTVRGYRLLAEKKTDIFFGAYPSEDQIAYAEENDTTFVYTPIGADAFVFFVHKDNPVNNLTSEQIRMIYSGEITNWQEVGGKNEPIAAFQRNAGSGSQSMLIRFMGDTPIMDAPTEMVNDFMSGIVEKVSDYKSKSGSIGFSFRYYMEGIIQNPDIKLLCVDGVAPTSENIKSGAYPITGPLYAVTYKENDNENVMRLLDWILSLEGQTIIEKAGYAGVQ